MVGNKKNVHQNACYRLLCNNAEKHKEKTRGTHQPYKHRTQNNAKSIKHNNT